MVEGNVGAVGDERGFPVYRERDLHTVACGAASGVPRDPHRRKSYFASELDRVKLEQMCSELIPRTEVEAGQAEIFKEIARMLDTLPSIIERDCGLPVHALARMEQVLDVVRTELRRRLTEGEVPAASAAPAVPAVAADG